ncbi:MAG: PhzF family phenazine biosynthesis protein [Planctomycetota bacterium]
MSGPELWHIDAFAEAPFQGNPAAVCYLDQALPEAWMQQVAAEMNLSETAFVQRSTAADRYSLRWFTPRREAHLCGHATLATAHFLKETGRAATGSVVVFETLSGELLAHLEEHATALDFPAIRSEPCTLPAEVATALGSPSAVARVTVTTGVPKYMVVLESEVAVRRCDPDFRRLARAHGGGVIVTAASETADYDFVSRYFAPSVGVDEDPVTGSAHCALAPYWSSQLGRSELTGFQASRRGGRVRVRARGDRVHLVGRAVTIVRGTLTSPHASAYRDGFGT